MKIELKSIKLQNFKKERNKEIEFTHNTIISGGNETGKSTIYDAYLWCLFGVTSRPDTTVQILNKDNSVIHKLETSVIIVLNYNNERDVKIERRLTERWKGKDTAEEKFLGTTQTRFVDDVPYSVTAFKEKLNSLCNYDDWFMLSNINLFWTYKVDARRKILMSLAGNINESELMQGFPAVYNGVVNEKKEIAEMLVQQKSTRKKANDELQTIPAKVQAQDALRINEDFSTLECEKIEIEAQLAKIDAALQGVVVDNTAYLEYENRLTVQKESYNKARSEWQKAHFSAVDNIFKDVSKASEELRTAEQQQKEHFDANVQAKVKLSSLEEEFNKLMQQWKDVNEKEFNFDKTDVCPVCGRPYTDEMKEKEYENAVSEFNTHKSGKLMEIQNKAQEKNGQIIAIRGCINTYAQITSVADNESVAAKQAVYDELVATRSQIQSQTWEGSEDGKAAEQSLRAIEIAKPEVKVDVSVEDAKKQKTALTARRDNILKHLAGREVNERIEDAKKELDLRSLELAQIVADCNEVIRQIKEYKKEKINIVEGKVNSYFSLIRWKFYEQNITNDDEKEICTAIDRNGVDYNNTNDGTVINMGIDIINGISKAKGIYVPLFVDRKESVEHALPSEQQTIYLQCKYGEPFKVEYL